MEEITFAWSIGARCHVSLGDRVKTRGGMVFDVERIEPGPEEGVYIFSGEAIDGGEHHVTGNEIAGIY
jgi:hypothetical protein